MRIIILLFLITNYINANQKIILQLSWLHQFQSAGYYIAKEKGFYKDAGIDIEINEFQFGMNLSTVLEEKKADFAIGRSSLLIDKANGKDVVAIFSAYQDSPLMLLTKEDSNIKSLKDLKNRNIMLTTDAKGTASILAMLSSHQIYLDDINIQKHTFNLDDLINGKTDAMGSYLSNETVRLSEKNIKYRVFHPKDYGFNFYDDILFTTSSFIKQNPELTKDFYEATVKGWEYAFNNIGETAQLIFTKYNTQNKSLFQLVREGEILKELAINEKIDTIGSLDENKLQKIVDVYKIMGLMNKDINLEEFIYEHNNKTVFNFKLTEKEIFIYSVLFIVLIGIAVFTIVYISIRRKWLITTDALQKEIKSKTRQLKRQTYIDSLTGSKNRKAYNEKIKEHLSLYKRYGTKFTLLFFDIDDFKKVNDIYGHKIGDKVLIDLVKIVKSTTRNNDFLFRVGGEEFIIILSQTQLESAKVVAEHVRETIENNLTSMNKEIVTISIGLTEVKENDDEDSIYTRADMLLYDSKKQGKNRVSY